MRLAAAPRGSHRVRAELCDALLGQATTVVVAGAVGIPLFALFQWHRRPDPRMVGWFLIQIAICVAIALVAWRYRVATRAGAADPVFSAGLYAGGLVTGGVFWGLAGVALFDPADQIGSAFLLLFLCGGGVTALLAAYAHPPAFLGYLGVTLIPILVRCLLTESMVYRTVGAAIGLFLILSVLAVDRLRQVLLRAAELRFRNQDLAASLRREKEKVEGALRAKSRFLAAASHDLRQPLHASALFLELLEQRLTHADERLFLGRIQSANRALEGLLGALLDVSRIDAQSLQPRRTHFRLGPLFSQLESELGELARRKGLTVEVAEPGLIVATDPELLGRVLRNLLANAVRYTADGHVRLTAVARGQAVVISVADTGPGIPPDEQEKVWGEFYQIGSRARDREQGLGLGLSIVRGLCQLLEHPVRLISTPARPKGTEFLVEVRAGGEAQIPLPEPGPAAGPAALGLAGRRVLVLDDEREIRSGMAFLLESWQCHALCAGSLDEALALMNDGGPPDAVICDHGLAETTGTEALARLEAHVGARLSALIVTGDTSPERIRELKRSGRTLLFKPVVPGKLRAALTALLAPSATVDLA